MLLIFKYPKKKLLKEIIKNRLKVYQRETAPLLTYYKDEIINIKAEGSTPEKISKEIIGKIK